MSAQSRRLDGPARRVAVLLTVVATSMTGLTFVTGPTTAAPAEPETALYLVTLPGPGRSGDPSLTPQSLRRTQDRVLTEVAAPEPVYRWTTALNGFAVRLSPGQAARLRASPDVAWVERNAVRRLAAAPVAADHGHGDHRQPGRPNAGKGSVVGVIDTGIWPESPVFSASPGLGRSRHGFRGDCQPGRQWGPANCSAKVVGARWYVDGFGADAVRASSYLSPRDDSGHGTQVASIAAGNSAVDISLAGDDPERLGEFSGVAPHARLAVYKACWSAPDPDDDGCATADLVTAIDQATGDGVDVLNLSVDGPDGSRAGQFDTVERALLGAAEADIVVVASAGNDGHRSYAAHPSPWVTTVGATEAPQPRGVLRLGDQGPRLAGAMSSRRRVAKARLVLSSDVPAAGATPAAAGFCRPGSLDAKQVAGRIVVCRRGAVGRVDKSAAVDRADGVGMVLVNTDRGAVETDIHSVPTVHLNAGDGRTLERWIRAHPHRLATLRPAAPTRAAIRAPVWSAGGDPLGGAVKPDLIAPGVGLLGNRPPGPGGLRWGYLSGTSAAAAVVSGEAAVLRSRYPRWTASEVRSALAVTARPGDQSPLRQGAGRLDPTAATRPGLLFDVAPERYRGYLDLEVSGAWLNQPSLHFDRAHTRLGRSVRAVGPGRSVWRVRVEGFAPGRVSVAPAVMTMRPGQTARFRMQVFPDADGVLPPAEGCVVWADQHGRTVRVPVVVSR